MFRGADVLALAHAGATAGTSGGDRAGDAARQGGDEGAAAAGAAMSRGLRGNWEAFWAAALRDHCHAGLIWNERTRSELREALQARAQEHHTAL